MKKPDVGITRYVVHCIIENDVRRHLKINSLLKNDKIEVVLKLSDHLNNK